MPAADVALEDAADDDPGRELHAAARREEHCGAERGRNVDVAPLRVGVAAGEDIERYRKNGEDENDIQEVVVPEEGDVRKKDVKEDVGTYSCPGPNSLREPTAPQMAIEETKIWFDGHVNPFSDSGVQAFSLWVRTESVMP